MTNDATQFGRDLAGTLIEIGRDPGVIQVTFLAPLSRLDAVGLGDIAREQYDL